MTRREKIIVGLMLAAAAGAAIDFAMTSLIPSADFSEQDAAAREMEHAIAKAQISLATFQLNELHEQLLNGLSEDWRPDLFQPHPGSDRQDGKSKTEDSKADRLLFTGYFEINGKPFAIIDGRDYTIGDHLENNNLQVIRIQPEQTELQADKSDRIIVIPIATDVTN